MEEASVSSVVTYFVTYVCLTFVEFIAYAILHDSIKDNSHSARGVSLLFLGINATIDMSLALWHICFLFTGLFAYDLLSIPFTCSVVVCLAAVTPLASAVWKAGNSQANSVSLIQIEQTKFEFSFMLRVLIAAVVLSLLAHWIKLVTCVAYLFFVPQIVKNVSENYRFSMSPAVYVLVAASRLGIVCYYFGYTGNFAAFSPSPGLVVFTGVILGVQVLVLYLQTRLGPRCFLPKGWFSQSEFSYYRSQEEDESLGDRDCCICLQPLAYNNHTRAGRTVHTPCSHQYHHDCLQRWTNISNQCPTCRRDIPEIEE
jgi:hypothetical protein